jgi:hypothetical protein
MLGLLGKVKPLSKAIAADIHVNVAIARKIRFTLAFSLLGKLQQFLLE